MCVQERPCERACIHNAQVLVAGSPADSVAARVSRLAHCLGCLAASGHYAAAKLPADGFGWELEQGVTAEGMQMRA